MLWNMNEAALTSYIMMVNSKQLKHEVVAKSLLNIPPITCFMSYMKSKLMTALTIMPCVCTCTVLHNFSRVISIILKIEILQNFLSCAAVTAV